MREYADRPISDDSLTRILQAGRVAGSSKNRQQWTFYVVRNAEKRRALSETVYEPDNLLACNVAIGIGARSPFDGGRCSQNMVLAAWAEGIGSSPNSARDSEAASRILGIKEEQRLVTILSLGYPLQPHPPREGDVEGILQRIKRKSLDELVVWLE